MDGEVQNTEQWRLAWHEAKFPWWHFTPWSESSRCENANLGELAGGWHAHKGYNRNASKACMRKTFRPSSCMAWVLMGWELLTGQSTQTNDMTQVNGTTPNLGWNAWLSCMHVWPLCKSICLAAQHGWCQGIAWRAQRKTSCIQCINWMGRWWARPLAWEWKMCMGECKHTNLWKGNVCNTRALGWFVTSAEPTSAMADNHIAR